MRYATVPVLFVQPEDLLCHAHQVGKIEVTGVEEILGHKVFVLRFLQCRDEDWIGRPFFAKYDPKAVWYDDLEPLPGMELPWDENGIPKPVTPRLN